MKPHKISSIYFDKQKSFVRQFPCNISLMWACPSFHCERQRQKKYFSTGVMTPVKNLSLISILWCLQFPPKNKRKQVNLRFHSSKVEFVFWRKIGLKKSFRLCLTFSIHFKGLRYVVWSLKLWVESRDFWNYSTTIGRDFY